MYMDIDSILFENKEEKTMNSSARWVSCIDNAVLTREDLCILYGSWADDAAGSAFLRPADGLTSAKQVYAA